MHPTHREIFDDLSTELPAEALLCVAWLAYCTGRTVAEQLRAIVGAHQDGLRGDLHSPYHSEHCRAAVRACGWPRFHVPPATRKRVTVPLRRTTLEALRSDARRAHRDPSEQLRAIVESYLRTLRHAELSAP